MREIRPLMIWAGLATIVAVPIFAAAASPLLAWRDPIYITAGFAGIIAMVLLLFQPLLAAGYLPKMTMHKGRRIHRWAGSALIAAILIHVLGLWITSPADVTDALLFVSPTPFSNWGVSAMWTLFAAGFLAAFRQRLRLRPRTWRLAHTCLVVLTVIGSVVHALLIEGTMETNSKAALCLMVVLVTIKTVTHLRPWKKPPRRQ